MSHCQHGGDVNGHYWIHLSCANNTGDEIKIGQIFTDLLDTASLPIVTMCLISIPSAVYLFLFVGLIVALSVKEKYILNGPLKFFINMFVLIGEWAYLSVYLVAMYLPLLQCIEKLSK